MHRAFVFTNYFKRIFQVDCPLIGIEIYYNKNALKEHNGIPNNKSIFESIYYLALLIKYYNEMLQHFAFGVISLFL